MKYNCIKYIFISSYPRFVFNCINSMNAKVHIGNEIRKCLYANNHSIMWLALEIDRDQSNLSKLLRRSHLNSELIYDISKVLGVDFFAHFSKSLLDED